MHIAIFIYEEDDNPLNGLFKNFKLNLKLNLEYIIDIGTVSLQTNNYGVFKMF